MKTFMVEGPSPNLSASVDTACRAVVCKKVEGGYIIDINGERILARTDLGFAEGQTLTLKPVRFSADQIVFKVLNRQDKATHRPPAATPAGRDLLPILTLSKLNIPITQNRLKIFSRVIEKLVEEIDRPRENPTLEDEILPRSTGDLWNNAVEEKPGSAAREAAEPSTFIRIALKVLNAAHADLKDVKVAFFSVGHPFFGNILLKVKRRREERQGSPPVNLSFLVNIAGLGRILVNLTYSKGVIDGSLVFEDREKLDIARKRYEDIREKIPRSLVVESLRWKWQKVDIDKFLFEDLDPSGINSGVDITV
ncbi:hypothetical protein [Thermosediminibacter oceani]|uniref:Uncharacterized protein n=1 Tax=Thermosediminibacter oceani (strain ATCC BAA-1034 / DSM 16646 / JW/IW-1228P) TaxID=555079 RepID=D9RZ61_THEOJ|nr:hypothetical protein [Thermosediminibacter oceani]ADL08615.1 hypothetical protein Toce_1886 [Thermosediminibacter oceani DSM 16646]